MSPRSILVVDDEQDIINLIEDNLQSAGFKVSSALDGLTALEKAKEEHPALIILDIMLPDLGGTEVCKMLKKDESTAHIPVIMLTAKGDEIDRVVGFELGADDYVTKPFSPRELALRAKAVLRRMEPNRISEKVVKVGSLTIDIPKHRVTVSDKSIKLTATEFRLLTRLVKKAGKVQTRESLLNSVWGYDYYGYTRTVDTHIRRLREKLGPAGDYIETVRGVGYSFKEE